MAAIINTGLLTKGLRSEFFSRFDQTLSRFGLLSTRIPSTSDSETYKWLGSIPKMREWGTGRQSRGVRTESYSVENLKYEATLEVDRDEISDDQTGQINIRVNELAARSATHKDYLISQLLINGATAGFTSYDGVTFFNATHASGASGNQSNLLTFDASSHTSVTTAEFASALRNAIAQMMTFKDDVGDPMMNSATGLAVVVPPQLTMQAMEACASTLLNNTTNVLNGIAEVIPFPWLTDGTKWYLCKTDGVIRPFIFQDREPVEFTSLTEDSDEGFRREKYLFGVRARYRMHYGYWQYAVQTTFN